MNLSISTPQSSTSSFNLKELEVLSANDKQFERKTDRYPRYWHFLTLGIPKLLEALSLFFDGIVHREKMGHPLPIRFTRGHLCKNEIKMLNKFQSLQEKGKGLLSVHEFHKALALLNELSQACTQAAKNSQHDVVAGLQPKLQALKSLIEKNKNDKLNRAQFSEEDWQTLDVIKYELTKEGFEDLTEIFNSQWFQDYNIQGRIAKYGVNYNEAVIAEILALSLAYIEGLDGMKIRLPVFDVQQNIYRLVEYEIKKSVLGDALPCYTLESETPHASPWFIIRGTQRYTTMNSQGKEQREGSFESILADVLDHKCVSRHLINKALIRRPIVREKEKLVQRESLGDFFRRCRQQNKTVLLAGHSLGGTLVNALTVEFYNDVQTGYSFSGTGVSSELATQWNAIGRARDIFKGNFQSKLVNFDHEGDIVPAGGRRLIGLHLAIEALAHQGPNGIYQSHVRGHLNRDFQIQKVNLAKENNKPARSFCERIRVIIGACLGFLLTVFSGKYLPDWWKNRKVYQKHAAFYRKIHLSLI